MRARDRAVRVQQHAIKLLRSVTWELAEEMEQAINRQLTSDDAGKAIWTIPIAQLLGRRSALKDILYPKDWPK